MMHVYHATRRADVIPHSIRARTIFHLPLLLVGIWVGPVFHERATARLSIDNGSICYAPIRLDLTRSDKNAKFSIFRDRVRFGLCGDRMVHLETSETRTR